MELKDKVAIVTGAGRGIGLGIALELADRGCKVVISDISSDVIQKAAEEVGKGGAESLAVKCDVSKKEEADNLVKQTVEKFGRLDILVNNAGIYPYKPFGDMGESDWDKVIDVNLKGVYLCSQAAVRVMEPNSKIVNISSIAAYKAFQSLVHYCASKGGVNGFTRALALELAPKKINVNAVAPGAIETPGAVMDEEAKKQTVAMIPKGRTGKPADIAKAVAFFASDDSDYITGQVIVVDGGWTIR